ncbi:MAG: peptidylprolyl isomerase [Oscillospiraceae bacterium]
MIKKIMAAVIALTLSACCLASCGSKKAKIDSSSKTSASSTADGSKSDSSSQADAPEPSLTIDGKKVDTENLVMLTIDDYDIDFDTFRYFYYYTLNTYTQYGMTVDQVKETDDTYKMFIDQVITTIKNEFVAPKLAAEKKITLTDDDKKAIEENYKDTKSQFGSEEEYKQGLKNNYMTEKFFKMMLEHSQYYDKLFGENGVYATSKEDFKKIVKDTSKYSRVIHILIPYESQVEITDESALDAYNNGTLSEKSDAKKEAYNALSEDKQKEAKEKAKKVAEEVLKKAKSGEDFEELIKKYGWDPGMESQPEGYYINQDTQFVQEFKDAAFKLKENEISDLVENTSYGWFIIKRLPVDMDYVDENYSTLVSDYDNPRFQEIYNTTTEKMKVTESDTFKKMTKDSLT